MVWQSMEHVDASLHAGKRAREQGEDGATGWGNVRREWLQTSALQIKFPGETKEKEEERPATSLRSKGQHIGPDAKMPGSGGRPPELGVVVITTCVAKRGKACT
jgi:hypothetical protein